MVEAHVLETTVIEEPFPDGDDLRLSLAVGVCRLRIVPGDGELWVSGSYRDPTGQVPVKVLRPGSGLGITQGYEVGHFSGLFQGLPALDLALGGAKAYAFTLEGGASENSLDLGGLPLKSLAIKHGAGKFDVDFTAPNPEPMSLLDVRSGAGAFEAMHLANANFAEMRLQGGAASYRLDFGGSLLHDARVSIMTGMAAVDLVVPQSTAARVRVEVPMGSFDVGDGWTTRDGAFWNEAAIAGTTPLLRIEVKVTLGSLRLKAG